MVCLLKYDKNQVHSVLPCSAFNQLMLGMFEEAVKHRETKRFTNIMQRSLFHSTLILKILVYNAAILLEIMKTLSQGVHMHRVYL